MTLTLRYSRLISIPVIGYFLITIQLLLIFLNVRHVFYLSEKEKKLLKKIVLLLEKKYDSFICQSWQIGHPLTFFTKPITLDLVSIQGSITEKHVYRKLLWTMGSSSQLTPRTKKTIKKILITPADKVDKPRFLSKFVSKNLERLTTPSFWILCFLVVLAFALRTYRLPDRIRWWSDIPRDMIVSKHLAFEHEKLINGPTASGVITVDPVTHEEKLLHYPTYYYWYLALLWKFLGSVEGIVAFNILLHSLAIFPLYLCLQLLHKNKLSSILTCLMYSIAAFTVNNSLIIITHQVSVPFIIFGVWLFTYGYVKKKWLHSLSALLYLTFFTTFQYSLIILVVLICFTYITQLRKLVILGASSFVTFLLLHLNQLEYYGIRNFLTPFLHTNSVTVFNEWELTLLIRERLIESRVTQLILDNSPATYLFFISLVNILILLNFLSRKTNFRWQIRFISIFILGLNLLAITKDKVFLGTYLLYADYAWLYLLSFLIPILELEYKTRGKLIGTLYILLAIIAFSTSLRYLKDKYIYKEYYQSKEIAQFILDRYPYNIFFRVGSYYSSRNEDGTIGYWIEELSGKQIYYLSDEDRSYEYLNNYWEKTILICQKHRMAETIQHGFCEPLDGYELTNTIEFQGHFLYEYQKEFY